MEKLFTVTYNVLTKEINVCLSPMGTVADHNALHFDSCIGLFMHVYADNEKKALKIARIDMQNQLYILSKDIDKTIETNLSKRLYRVVYNTMVGDITVHRQEEDGEMLSSDCLKNIDKVKHTGAYVLEVTVMSLNKREAKDRALDLISEYFSDKAKKAAERKKVVEEFDDED